MNIDWGSLGVVAIVSLAVSVAVVSLLAFAIVGLSAREHSLSGGGSTAGVLSPSAGTAVAGLCLLAVVAIVGYGLYVIIS
jgi:hypothetical protein